jgi:hypothetical protein
MTIDAPTWKSTIAVVNHADHRVIFSQSFMFLIRSMTARWRSSASHAMNSDGVIVSARSRISR